MKLTVAFRMRPFAGEVESGDAFLVRPGATADQQTLTVIDALGHGPAAARVARVAVDALQSAAPWASSSDAAVVIHGLDQALRGTRGAGALVLAVSGAQISCAGVGNIELRASTPRVFAHATPGVLGALRRPARAITSTLTVGDRIALFSDGVSGRFVLADTAVLSADRACATIFDAFARTYDDATLAIVDVTA